MYDEKEKLRKGWIRLFTLFAVCENAKTADFLHYAWLKIFETQKAEPRRPQPESAVYGKMPAPAGRGCNPLAAGGIFTIPAWQVFSPGKSGCFKMRRI